MNTFHRIGLLFWKNMILRKRHYIVTSCEVVLPTLFAILVAFALPQLRPARSDDPTPIVDDGTFDVPTQVHPEDIDLVRRFSYNFLTVNQSYYPVILFTPPNPISEAIIGIMDVMYKDMVEDRETFNESFWNRCHHDFTTCTEGVWRGVENEREMELFALDYFSQRENYETAPEYPEGILRAGIVFTSDLNAPITNGKISYTLRFPGWFGTEDIWDSSETGGGYTLYDFDFIGLQIMLDQAIIKYHTNNDLPINISAQQFPYPAYDHDDGFGVNNFYLTLIPQIVILGFIVVVPSILRIIVNEKQTGVHELLALMGLPNWMHWLGYMINSMVVLTISVTIVVALLFIPFFDGEGVFSHSDPSLWWIMLFLYSISLTAFCFFISTFFHRPALAITVGIVIYYISYYAVVTPIEANFDSLHLGAKMAICLLPNNALHYAARIMGNLELRGEGAHWNRIGEGINTRDTFGLYLILIMFLVNTTLYLLLSLYLERVLPSPYGLRKPWYYIFMPSEWGIGKKKAPIDTHDWTDSRDMDAFEKEPQNLKVGIDIKNLRKEFNGSVAVSGMNLKMFEGQITALLGQNGAGKTTTMSMLTGMFAPTSGTAYVNGYNIRTEMEKVRGDLGLCPQHNMLFNRLTTKENLVFFGRLSGRSTEEAIAEAEKLLGQLRLDDKKNALSASLSGGQKRKLSLGCALKAGTKVVILDEPTSGLDVENRRMLWDLLLEFRMDRTIVLTTHFMEEADVLGDRIAIMDQGKLVCAGTPMFLKNYYGTGYILKLTIDNSKLQPSIFGLVQNHIPGATICKQGVGDSRELAIAIPSTNTAEFPDLFSELSARKAQLGIQSFGLAQTTMDDVFVRVGEISSANSSKDDFNDGDNNNYSGELEIGSTKKITGTQLIFQQIWVLLKKKMLYGIRRPIFLAFQLLTPILLIIASILITNSTFSSSSQEPPLTMTLSSYDNPITSFSSSTEELVAAYESAVGPSASRVDEDDMVDYYLRLANNDLTTFRDKHIVGATLNGSTVKAMYSTVAPHGFPLAVNLVMSALFQNMSGQNVAFEVTNHPFSDEVAEIRRLADTSYNTGPALIFMILIPTGLSLVAASLVILPIEEKRCSAKQLQLMSGVDSMVYWLSFFLWDFLFLVILALLMVMWFPILEDYRVFTSNGGLGVALLILVVFAFQTIPFTYLMSLMAGSVPGGFSLVTIINIITGGGLCLAISLSIVTVDGVIRWLPWLARIFPGFGVSSALTTFAQTSMDNVKCNILSDEHKELLCRPGEAFLWGEVRDCCPQCGQEGFPDCFKITNYLTWSTISNPFGPSSSTVVYYFPGIMEDLFAMVFMGIVYFVLLILIERGLIVKLKNLASKAGEVIFVGKTTDADVIAEHDRVTKLVSAEGRTTDDALVVSDFCKTFGTFSAVTNVNFGVHHGECFGLLGVNGAGKTTTFRILTGDEVPSQGNAFIRGKNLKDDRNDFLKNMGYCPQFDGIIGVLTGNEMLEIFGGLRGIPRKAIGREARNWMSKMGLSKSGKVECKNYSGGMKRRLSSAMAMIGEPQIILLDEPTTGVDPVARREFWKIITKLKNAGQAIVLTSHSMEECEQLCTRLAIMVNGEFQCLGPVQHLKDKFAKGYSLAITLKYMVDEITASRLDNLKHHISAAFTPCTLKDQHQNILEFHLPNTNLEWAYLFGTIFVRLLLIF